MLLSGGFVVEGGQRSIENARKLAVAAKGEIMISKSKGEDEIIY